MHLNPSFPEREIVTLETLYSLSLSRPLTRDEVTATSDILLADPTLNPVGVGQFINCEYQASIAGKRSMLPDFLGFLHMIPVAA